MGTNYRQHSRAACTVTAHTYIAKMVKTYLGDEADLSPSREQPAAWSYAPADETLDHAYAAAVAQRAPASKELTKRYQSLFGALMHAVKYRPEIAVAIGKCGTCLSFPTEDLYRCLVRVLVYLGRTPSLGMTYSKNSEKPELHAYADSDWSTTRSTTGFVIFLAGAAICVASRRQHCITMSSTEAELVALADLAIELLYIKELVTFMGYKVESEIPVYTDNKGAYDLCHRYTSAQHSRHVDRKVFKMRELRGAGVVTVDHVPTDKNPADIFTKILKRQPFEQHRKTVMNNACEPRRASHVTHGAGGAEQP